MRKSELVERILQKTGQPRTEVMATVEQFFKEIKKSLNDGEAIYMRGFGTFNLKKRAFKKARIIKTGEVVYVPEHHIPFFIPAKEFREAVKNKKFMGL